MAYFDDVLLSEIRDRNDIIELISSYTELKKSGSRYLGLCPFHREKTPSFFVSAEDRLYYCFGCHEGGNIINFVEKINNLDFTEAVKFLADRAHIALPEEPGKAPEEYQQKKRLYDVNRAAARYFHNNLINSPEILKYLSDRGLNKKTITSFGLGYAKDSYNDLRNHLLSLGFKEFELVSAGLNLKKEKNSFDFFRNRVIFPVIDLRGNVIAFGGRVTDNSLPKYLNTGDTPIFKKRHNLFAMNLAKNSSKEFIILAEGYMDVITMHQYGFSNAVASLGTSFCEEHASLLKRYTKNVTICYDSDSAGRNALKKAAEILLNAGISVKAAVLSGGKDPDEILKKYGSEYFENILKNAKPYVEYMLEAEKENWNLTEMEGKINYSAKATAYLSLASTPVERELYIQKISEELGISPELLRNEYKKKQKDEQKSNERKDAVKERYRSASVSDEDKLTASLKRCEGELLNIVLNDNKCFSKLKPMLSGDFFHTESYKKIFLTAAELKENDSYSLNTLMDRLPKDEASEIAMLKMRDIKFDSASAASAELIKRAALLRNQININKSDNLEDLNEQIIKLRQKRNKKE